MTLTEIVSFVERLNLSHHQNVIGPHFPEVLALLSIVFGGAFLLYGWRHHEYFLGVTGLLVGAWAGLLLRRHVAPDGLPAFAYMAAAGAAGAYIGACWRHVVGILLGGFTAALVASVFAPALFDGGRPTMASACVIFLLGGGLGAVFPKFFFIVNSSLIGSVFVTYGVSVALLSPMTPATGPMRTLLHLAVFLPLFLFGMIYQGLSGKDVEIRYVETSPSPRPAAKPKPAPAE